MPTRDERRLAVSLRTPTFFDACSREAVIIFTVGLRERDVPEADI